MLAPLADVIMPQSSERRSTPLLDRYRCSAEIPDFGVKERLKETPGFFRFGPNLVCYGQTTGNTCATVNGNLFDASGLMSRSGNTIFLPFDVDQILDNLRYERYVDLSGWQARVLKSWIRDAYYSLRPMFPVSFRKHLQKLYLRDWEAIRFPSWPVDRTVDVLIEKLLVLAMQSMTIERLPFIWFWPEEYEACAIVTHDVETSVGRDFSERLMDIDDGFGIKTSFQIVPEERYAVPDSYLQMIRDRGFEINVHGLNHDGNLFRDRQTFLNKAKHINRYAEKFGARGFRSPVLYRNAEWFRDLNFSYDMSVPNVARLEPQRGGCCTVMPYFLPGGMTELPVTGTEDYTLFHILQDYSATLWKQQMHQILEGHGLMHFIIHPDYITESRAQDGYRALLDEIGRLRSDRGVWVTLPGEVDRWWRDRSAMTLKPAGSGWTIEGKGSERARVAHACLDGDRLVYEFH